MEKEIERLVDVHIYDINKPKEEAKRLIREFIEKNGASFPENSEVICAINSYYNQKKLRHNILDLTMYRIMMRGDRNESSLRRAYLFAKEFRPFEIDFIVDYAIQK